ncbi:OmpA family protein [Rapidithrix thailandica]|uniref:OmpA family protein n=1 Tax=Rapidithrix thailandica TaxID=413964 RepID=A0AAW9S2I8_9BACT
MKKFTLYFVSLSILFSWGCSSTFKTARKKYDRGEFNTAIGVFEKAMKEGNSKNAGRINFYIGECYRLSNRIWEAEPYYTQALQAGFTENDVIFHHAYALKANGRYEEASAKFQQYFTSGGDLNKRRRAKEEIEIIKNLAPLLEEHEYIKVTNCEALNSSNSEYAPVFYQDRLVFTSNRDAEKVYEATGTGFTDLFYYNIQDQDLCNGTVERFNEFINLPEFHEASPTFSHNGKTMIFARSNSGKKKEEYQEVNLYISRLEDDEWSEPEVLPISAKDAWDGCPAISADGKTLYFASNRPGGYGGLDIWRATKNSRGQWARVSNLGSKVNTSGNEMFPFVSRDAKLYFASDGHPGIGGLDIFVATRKSGKINIENMGKPYNSPADDFALTFKDPKTGFFSSNRNSATAKGDDDIYYFVDETPELKKVNYYLAGTAYEEKEVENELLSNVALALINDLGERIDSTYSDSVGRYRFEPKLLMGVTYTIVAEKDSFLVQEVEYPTAGKEVDQKDLTEPETDIVLESEVHLAKDIFRGIETGKMFTLENIYYDYDKFDIRTDAAKELDKLVTFLKSNPDIRIELGSHTDSRERTRGYNIRLSKKRAKAAVDYIVSKGINPDRIEAKGYGATLPVVEDAITEEEHQLNRRTTIFILDDGEALPEEE